MPNSFLVSLIFLRLLLFKLQWLALSSLMLQQAPNLDLSGRHQRCYFFSMADPAG
jgi:hypothetical protein